MKVQLKFAGSKSPETAPNIRHLEQNTVVFNPSGITPLWIEYPGGPPFILKMFNYEVGLNFGLLVEMLLTYQQ